MISQFQNISASPSLENKISQDARPLGPERSILVNVYPERTQVFTAFHKRQYGIQENSWVTGVWMSVLSHSF